MEVEARNLKVGAEEEEGHDMIVGGHRSLVDM